MDGVLVPLKTISLSSSGPAEPHLVASGSGHMYYAQLINSPESALEALKSKPDLDLLTRVLRWLDPSPVIDDKFNIKIPSPKATQIIYMLVAEIVPHYYSILNGNTHAKRRKRLLRSLRSTSGIGVIIARLSLLQNECKSENFDKKKNSQAIKELLTLLESILIGDNTVHDLWIDISTLIYNVTQQDLLWKELISLLASGRLLSIAAEANQILKETSLDINDGSWLGDGVKYSTWIGQNCIHTLKISNDNDDKHYKALSHFISKALKLGYTGELVAVY